MRRSKQASILATMVVTGLLGIGVFGGGSASADVLCKTYTGWPYCSAEDKYGVGKEFAATQEGYATMKLGLGTSIVMASCGTTGSNLNMTVTKAGGNGYLDIPEVDTTNLAFGSDCGNDSISVVNDGTAAIQRWSESENTLQGSFIPTGLQIKVRTNWVYEDLEYGANEFGECTYEIKGAGKIAGPKTYGGYYTVLEFNEAVGDRVSGSGPGCGIANARLTAKFRFNPTSGHIYLMVK